MDPNLYILSPQNEYASPVDLFLLTIINSAYLNLHDCTAAKWDLIEQWGLHNSSAPISKYSLNLTPQGNHYLELTIVLIDGKGSYSYIYNTREEV